MKDIIVLGKDLYLVHGKVSRDNTPGMFEGEDGEKELIEIADKFLYQPMTCTDPEHPEIFGFHKIEDDPDGAKHDFSTCEPLATLSDAAKAIVRKEAPELEKWL